MYGARSFVDAGGLMALHGNTSEIIRRTAALVVCVLAGAPLATLPIGPPIGLELTLNRAAARRVDVVIPPSLLARANAVST